MVKRVHLGSTLDAEQMILEYTKIMFLKDSGEIESMDIQCASCNKIVGEYILCGNLEEDGFETEFKS